MRKKLLLRRKRNVKENWNSSAITVRVLNANKRKTIVKGSWMQLANGSAKLYLRLVMIFWGRLISKSEPSAGWRVLGMPG